MRSLTTLRAVVPWLFTTAPRRFIRSQLPRSATLLAVILGSVSAQAGLVGLWRFDEGDGQTVGSAVNGLNGNLGNSAADTVRDPAWNSIGSTLGAGGGNSLYFASGQANVRAQVDNSGLLAPTNAITLAIDFNPDYFPQGVLISKHSGGTSGSYMLSLTPANGYYSFTIINASSTRVNLNWPIPSSDAGAWHQLVGTYDSASGVMKLYYDGILRTNTTQTGKIKVVTAPLMFGNYNQDNTLWEYAGYIDNGALFDVALGDGGVAVGQEAAAGSDIYKLFHNGAVSFIPSMIVTNPPISQAVAFGGSARFNVGISGGTPPLAYRWQFNGTNINGATTSQYSLTNAQSTNAGSYNVIVTDANSLSVTSPAAILLVGTVGHNLVGLWKFDEGDGQALHDSSGNGLDGYLGTSASDSTYDATWSTSGSTLGAGNGGGALYFPPGEFDIQGRVDNNPMLTPSSALTITADIQWDNQGTYGIIVSKHSGSSSGSYLLDITSTFSQFEFMVINASGTRVNIDWTFPPEDVSNGYHQLVGTYDGLTMRLYYDGVLQATAAQSGGIQSVSAPLLFGNFNAPTTSWEYTGLIDNVALFSTALGDGGVAIGQEATADSDIYKLFHQGASAFIPAMVMTNRPASQAIALGGSATFNVGVQGGSPPLAYHWQLNGTNIASGTTSQLTVSNASLADAGSYTIIVTDASSLSITSPPALLLVGTVGHTLVGLWQLDEGDGQIVRDSSGNKLDGYLGLSPDDVVQDPAWSTNGSTLGAANGTVVAGNNALFFPADVPTTSDDVVRIDNTPLLTPANALTIAADIQWNNSGTHGVIVGKHGGGNAGSYFLDIATDNTHFEFMVVNASGSRINLDWAFPPEDVGGGYHQLVGTYDGLTMRLYYDGILEATAAQSGNIQAVPFPLLIGDYSQTNVPVPGVWRYEGLIDSVALFSTALGDGGVSVGQPAAAGSDIYRLLHSGAALFAPPTLIVSQNGAHTLQLNWTGTNVLLAAPSVLGPWTPVVTNTGPYNVDTRAQVRQYYRCVHPLP